MKNSILQLQIAVTFVMSLFLFCSQTVLAYEETRDLDGFSEINFSISGDLFITQGKTFSIKIEGAEKDVKNIITRLEGRSLVVKTNSDWKNYGDIKVYIILPELNELSLAGSGNAYAKETIKADEIEISVAGSGDIYFKDLNAREAEVSVAGSGDISLKGSNNEQLEINIAGSGDVVTSEYESTRVEVNISGSGTAKVFATDKLITNIVGSGSVYYKGKPLIDANSIGSGKTRSL